MANTDGPTYIALAQQKGGCGKSISVCWLALLLSRKHRVAVIDLDPQGGTTTLLATDQPFTHGAYDLIVGSDIPKDAIIRTRVDNCMLMPATSTLTMAEMDVRVQSLAFDVVAKRINKTFRSFDYILFDCGAGLGILTSLAMSVADVIIMPLPPGMLEERALLATYDHVSRLRRHAGEVSLALPVMQGHPGENSKGPRLSTTAIPFDPDILHKFEQNVLQASSMDTSDDVIAAYFALIHEIGEPEWAVDEPESKSATEIAPEPVPVPLPEPEIETPEPAKPPSRPRPRTDPKMETMTDIFDALHEKRSRGDSQEDAVPKPASDRNERPSAATSRPRETTPAAGSQAQAAEAGAAVPTYQSLRDIHHDTLDEAPKTRTWFWLRLGLALIGIGIAIIGLFTNYVGSLAMWSAVVAVVILLIPDLILRFVLRDKG